MDKNLWKEIIDSVIPLKKRNKTFTPEFKPIKKKKNSDEISVSFFSIDDIKKIKHRNIIEPNLSVNNTARINKNIAHDIKRNFKADARLDLHGKTLEKAFSKFISFINNNYDKGNRNIIVITGKGTPEKNTGIIRQNFSLWINNEDVKNKILYVTNANITDGGDGAFYILLRKKF